MILPCTAPLANPLKGEYESAYQNVSKVSRLVDEPCLFEFSMHGINGADSSWIADTDGIRAYSHERPIIIMKLIQFLRDIANILAVSSPEVCK